MVEEYIKRQNVLSYAYEIHPCQSDYFYIGAAEKMVLDVKKEIADELMQLPYTDDVCEVVHGTWKSFPDCGVTRCSACDWSIEEAWWSNYCPHCGAKMDLQDPV